MSAEPAVLDDKVAPDDLIPTPRTSAPADRVELFPLDSEEMRAAAQASGPIYASWLRYWQSLETTERDSLSYPGWVTGHLEGQLRSKTGGIRAFS